MSTPSTHANPNGHDPVLEVRRHLEEALASLNRLREVLPPPSTLRPPHTGESRKP